MCFLPIEDYPLYRRSMLDGARGWVDVPEWVREHPELVEQVMDRIRREGGLRSADFENPRSQPGGWWNWKDEKTALECLFILGELMIARRPAFQRVYDLRSRVLPGWDDGPNAANVPSREDYLQALTLRAVQVMGVALPAWVPDYFRLPKAGNAQRLADLAAEGQLLEIEVEGWPDPAYIHPSNRELAAAAAEGGLVPTVTTLLTPFDPLVWDRARGEGLV